MPLELKRALQMRPVAINRRFSYSPPLMLIFFFFQLIRYFFEHMLLF